MAEKTPSHGRPQSARSLPYRADARGHQPHCSTRHLVVRCIIGLSTLNAVITADDSLCYHIRYNFQSSAGASSRLLIPITRFPSGHAALPLSNGGSNPCNVNFTAGSKIPASGLGSESDDAADCQVRDAGELWYAYGYPDHSSSNTGYELKETVLAYFIVDEGRNPNLVIVLDKPKNKGHNHLGLYMESPSLVGSGCSVTLFDDGPKEEVEDAGCSAASGSSTSAPDCWHYDDHTGRGNLYWTWKGCCTDGFTFGILPVDFCLNLEFPTYSGVDTLAFGSATYQTRAQFEAADAFNRSIELLEFDIESIDAGLQICGYSCADYCAQYSECSSCAYAEGCSWCSASQSCVYEASANAHCPGDRTTQDECCVECTNLASYDACVSAAKCFWCFSSGECYSGSASDSTCIDCPNNWIATGNTTRACGGALDASGNPLDSSAVGLSAVANWCDGHGSCDFLLGSCVCDRGYWGDDCTQVCPGGADSPCSDAGVCDQNTGECYCACGYSGSECQLSTSACLAQCHLDGDDLCYVGDDACDIPCGKDLSDYCTSTYEDGTCAITRVEYLLLHPYNLRRSCPVFLFRRVHQRLVRC